jgi:hypothetical protein
VEETGYIEVTIVGQIGNEPIKPKDVDIAEIKDMINDVETFLYPNRAEKAERPHISYALEEGSARHLFYLPISAVLFFNSLTTEISNRGTADFLDYKRAEIIAKFQKKAKERDFEIGFSSSVSDGRVLTINKETNFYNAAANFINTEMVLYGKINSEGGNNPNFHIQTKEYGSLTVSATQQQLLEGEKRLYKVYGIRVSGKQTLTDGKPFELKLIDYIEYSPVFNRSELNLLITRAANSWEDVEDVDAWLAEIRSGTNG